MVDLGFDRRSGLSLGRGGGLRYNAMTNYEISSGSKNLIVQGKTRQEQIEDPKLDLSLQPTAFHSNQKDTKNDFSPDFWKKSKRPNTMTFHTLRQSTTDIAIKSWCSQSLVQIIQKRMLAGEFRLPDLSLIKCPPSVLRRIVSSIRDDMKSANSRSRFVSTVPQSKGVFHRRTKDWEIDGYEESEARAILEKYLKTYDLQMVHTSVFRLKLPQLRQALKNIIKEVQKHRNKECNVILQMQYFEGDLTKKLDQVAFVQKGGNIHKVNDPVKKMVIFSPATSMDEVSAWNLDLVVKFLTIWKSNNRLQYKVENLKKLKSTDLRKMLWDVRNMLDPNDIPSMQIPTYFTATVNPHTQPWEIESCSMRERMLFLTELVKALRIPNINVEHMTNRDITVKLLEIIASNEMKSEWTCVSMQMAISHSISQQKIDGPITTIVKIVKNDIIFPPEVSANTDCTQAQKWSPRVLVDILCSIDKITDNDAIYSMMLTRSDMLREKILKKIQILKELNSKVTYTSKINDYAFFSQNTKDWEINNYCRRDCEQIYRAYLETTGQDKKIPMISKVDLDTMKNILKLVRDVYLDKNIDISLQLNYSEEEDGTQSTSDESIQTADTLQNPEDFQQNKKDMSSDSGDMNTTFTNVNSIFDQYAHIKDLPQYIRTLCPHDRDTIIAAVSDMYNDTEGKPVIADIDAVPCLCHDTDDFTIVTWTPQTKEDILEAADNLPSSLMPEHYTGAILQLRGKMDDTTEFRAKCKDNFRIENNTPDSVFRAMSDSTLRQMYSFLMFRCGLQLPDEITAFLNGQEILLELQYLRALRLLGQQYFLDLVLEKMDTPAIKGNVKVYDMMKQRLLVWLVKSDRKKHCKRIITTKFDIDMIRNEIPRRMEHHIEAATEDWEITSLILPQAQDELKYQYQLLPQESQRDVDTMPYSQILLTLLSIRNKYLRIQEALNAKKPHQANENDANVLEDLINKCKESDSASDTTPMDNRNEEGLTSVSITPEKQSAKGGTNQYASVYDVKQDDQSNMECENEEGMVQETDNTSQQVFCQSNAITQEETEMSMEYEMKPAPKMNEYSRSINTVPEDEPMQEVNTSTVDQSKEHKVTSFGELGSNKMNLKGYNVMKICEENSASSKKDGVCSAKEVKKNVFFLRVKLAINNESTHVPSIIKKFFRVIREADPSFQLLLFTEKVTDNLQQDQEVLTDETQLPDEVSEIERWVKGIEIDINNKLCFSMRVTNSMAFKDLRAVTRAWCSKYDCQYSYDTIVTAQIFRAGWIKCVHPRYHNRDLIKTALAKQFPVLKGTITVYPRELWLSSKNDDKVKTTYGLAIDGDANHRVAILKALYSIKWLETSYRGSMFVPFRATKGCTIKHQHRFFESQNLYLENTYTKVVELQENFLLVKKDGSQTSFANWLESSKYNGIKIFQKVETFDHRFIRMIYHKDKEFVVQDVIAYLFANVAEEFGRRVAIKLMGPAEPFEQALQEFLADNEYGKKCGEMIEREPQPKQQHGKNKNTRAKRKSYAKAASADEDMHNQNSAEITNLSKRCEVLEDVVHQNAPEPNLQEVIDVKIKQALSAAGTNGIEKTSGGEDVSQLIDDRINKAITSVKAEFSQQLTQERTVMIDNLKQTETRIDKKIEEKEISLTDRLTEMQQYITKTQKESNDKNATMIMAAQQQLLNAITSIQTVQPFHQVTPVSVVEHSSHRGGVR